MPITDLEQARAACAAIRDFVATEMNWQWFRSEMLENDLGETGATAQNAKKLGEFLKGFSPENTGQAMLAELVRLREVMHWAQCCLTALNVGDIRSESPLHQKLRQVMIDFRACAPVKGGDQ